MGGLCKHKETGRKGVVLGILKKGITTARVQWENSGESADVPLTLLEHIESAPFCINKLTGVSVELLKYIARLSGVTNEVKMPQYILSGEEEKLLQPGSAIKERKMFYGCASDSHLCTPNKNQDSCKIKVSAKTFESLSNELLSNIMGEIKKLSVEKTASPEDEDSNEPDEQQKELKKQLMVKLLNVENECLRLAFLQCAAFKSLNILLTTNEYSQHFLFPSVFDKEETTEKTDAIKWIMSHVVNKSIQQCKLRHIISMAEIERAESMLQLNHVRCKSEEDLNKIFNVEVKVPKHPMSATPHSEMFKNHSSCLLPPCPSRFGMSTAFSDTTAGSSEYFMFYSCCKDFIVSICY